MTETPSERHNRLANEFVLMAGTETTRDSELLVVLESAILAVLHLLVRLYHKKPDHASILVEAALQRATERFAESQK